MRTSVGAIGVYWRITVVSYSPEDADGRRREVGGAGSSARARSLHHAFGFLVYFGVLPFSSSRLSSVYWTTVSMMPLTLLLHPLNVMRPRAPSPSMRRTSEINA